VIGEDPSVLFPNSVGHPTENLCEMKKSMTDKNRCGHFQLSMKVQSEVLVAREREVCMERLICHQCQMSVWLQEDGKRGEGS